MKRVVPVVIACAVLALLAGCVITQSATPRGAYPREDRYVAAVLDVENRVASDDVEDMTQRATNQLIDELLKYNRLRIVEREKLDLLLEEMRLGTSGLIDASQAKQRSNTAFGFAKAGNMTTETAAIQEASEWAVEALAYDLSARTPKKGF